MSRGVVSNPRITNYVHNFQWS